MNRSRARFSVVGAIVVASVAAPLLIQLHARMQWRERAALLQHLDVQLAELSEENKRLLDLAAQTRSSLSKEQFSELMKLRGEIGQLRHDANEVTRLQATNQQLLAASIDPEPESSPAPPDPQTVVAYWPKEQLTFGGYADLTSALKTALWAMSRNDPKSLAASVTPDAMSRLASVYPGS